jgi:hypothetical protein
MRWAGFESDLVPPRSMDLRKIAVGERAVDAG